MHLPPPEALKNEPGNPYAPRKNIDVVVFPTFLHLESCINAGLMVGAQYGHEEPQGAHTGDISMKMLKETGCQYVLCGHSERRAAHHETNEQVAAQVIAALEVVLHPILCIGETWEERKEGKQEEIVKEQLQTVLNTLQTHSQLTAHSSQLSIAYEPVWAISGGDPNKPAATPKDAQVMHSYIRDLLTAHRSQLTATPILYGGSMKPENAEELLKLPDVDGGLIGGASLKPESFQTIVEIAAKLSTSMSH